LRKTYGTISYHCKKSTNDIGKLLSLLKFPDQLLKLIDDQAHKPQRCVDGPEQSMHVAC